MGEAGRKLTIRMPDNPRLRSAEVGQIHLDPGATVRVGSPVMTLVSGKREHMVRAPRPGRVVPLVAAADEVEAGDPLYILNIDEAALAAAKKGDREVVAVEKAKWAAGVTPDVIEPVARHRADTAPRGRDVSEIVTEWAKPALAIALYVLACFALLPILNAFGREASTGTLIGMCLGSIVFGLIIFHLYAPDGGWWPRWTVRMVALSWVGISSIAIFYQQETPDDITLADAAAPLTRLFDADGTIAPAAPGPAPEPAVVLASGVAAGPSDARPVPNHTAPKSVLGEPGPAPTPHRVSVREWRRVNPTNTSGEVLAFDQRDVTGGGLGADPGDAAPTAVALAALTGGDALPEALAAMPDLSVFAAIAEAAADAAGTVTAMRITDVPTAPAADAGPGVAAIDDQGPGIREAVALTDNADPALRPGTDVAAIATWLGSSPLPVLKSEAPREPAEETEPAVAANSEAASAARATAQVAASGGAVARPSVDAEGSSEAWVQAQAIPVLRGQGAPAADVLDEGVNTDVASLGPVKGQPPSLLGRTGDPDLILFAMVNAARDGWMLNQEERLAGVRTEAPATAARRPAPAGGLAAAPVAIAATLATPAAADVHGSGGPVGTLPVIEGSLRPADQTAVASADLTGALSRAKSGGGLTAAEAPSALVAALTPSTAPTAPPWQPAPDAGWASRDLLFLFYDDPRLKDVPRIGDPWLAAVSPDLGAAIRSSVVEAVTEVVEVTNWCAAANDPQGTKEATLPGGAYRAAMLSDRIRLLRVRVEVKDGMLAQLEQEVPVFGGGPSGFFHNKMPLFGGQPDGALMAKAQAYMQSASNREIDRNTPPSIEGGHYFTSAAEAEAAIRANGCTFAIWNLGDGPVNAIGRTLAPKFSG